MPLNQTLTGSGYIVDPIAGTVELAASRASNAADNEVILSNKGASNFTYTVNADTLATGVILQQLSTGTITVAAGAGVTFVGATLATSGSGGVISVTATATRNTYIVKVT